MSEPVPRPVDVTKDVSDPTDTRGFQSEPPAANTQIQPPRPESSRPIPDIAVPPELTDHPRYKVLRPLGKGGMGAVFLAEQTAMGRTVALKTVNPALLAGHETALPRFQQEVRAAAALNHPNIVQAYDDDQPREATAAGGAVSRSTSACRCGALAATHRAGDAVVAQCRSTLCEFGPLPGLEAGSAGPVAGR